MKNDGGDADSFAIIGAAMEVHRQRGAGFLYSAYARTKHHPSYLRNLRNPCSLIPKLFYIDDADEE
jgi:hypothetical protein